MHYPCILLERLGEITKSLSGQSVPQPISDGNFINRKLKCYHYSHCAMVKVTANGRKGMVKRKNIYSHITD
jgi:hypothetical protein